MATDWNKLKVVDLKAELKRLGLPLNGIKATLVKRLEEANSEQDPEKDASQPPDSVREETRDASGESPPQQQEEDQEAEEAVVSNPAEESTEQPEAEAEAEATPAAQDVQDVQDAQDSPTPTVVETQTILAPSSSGATPLQPTEVIQDSQKRKRRSLSPAPSVEEVARKRARQEDEDKQENQDNHVVDPEPVSDKIAETEPQETEGEHLIQPPADVEMGDTKEGGDINREASPLDNVRPDDQNGHPQDVVMNDTQPTVQESYEDKPSSPEQPLTTTYPTEVERDVEPSIHPATSALYIKDFMRPLRPHAVKDHLVDLATPIGASLDDNTIVDFYLDTIRTHAFVVFSTISAASRVRTALHNRVWPDETNRKALWVDFIPSERFAEWVKMEQTSGSGRGSTSRYEVAYANDDDGNVSVRLEEFDGAASSSKHAPLEPEPQPERKLSIPTGPSRQFSGIEGAPTGPRANRGATMQPPDRMSRLDPTALSTRAYPSVTYQPVSDELVQRRLDVIAAAKTKDDEKDFGKEYKRYYFERGDALVDRGPEIFLGIRPPHREHERQRERERFPIRGRRGGGGGGRSRRFGTGMPIFHGVPRGGDRFRPGDSSASSSNGRTRYSDFRDGRHDGPGRYSDDRGSRRDHYGRR
ncbi:hypothetical protein F4819DRAFT_444610 [Hypoxylon fuscum]|nr:hypothetical protein F4819DRAFT_444610 [Hypoxylon fuscum]